MPKSPHHVSRFPESPWTLIPEARLQDWPQQAAAEAERVTANFAHPRDPDCVKRFLRAAAPRGRWLIHGAGSHTRDLLPLLQQAPDFKPVGIIDRLGDQIESRFGMPVFTPRQARDQNADGVLLSHTCREWDMAVTLAEAGFPAERIHALYRHPDYAAACAPWYADLEQRIPAGIENLIIRCGRSTVIDDAHLARCFNPDTTLSVFAGRRDYFEPATRFPQINVAQSLQAVFTIIRRTGAKTIYLSTGWFNNELALALYQQFPDRRIIHEIFDWNVLFPSDTTVAAFGHHPGTIQRNLLGEYVSLQRAAAVVSKRDGPYWARVVSAGPRPYLAFHAGFLENTPTHTPRSADGTHLIYGGILPDPEFLANYQIDYDFLPLFETLATKPNLSISLFNSLDDGDPRFHPYHERFAAGALRYHARLPYAQFLEHAARGDYGWQAVIHRKEFAPDQICVLPSRAIGYLAAGLPLILDSGWHFLAELVNRFDAGLILDDFRPDAVLARIKGAPHAHHRAGAARLYQWIGQHNEKTLAQLHFA
ncbi:hypothetical protein [Acanthopleuribacter pedis]|uniref:Uncharacterized protein n=1 Tax=Acanthopleuribacter pedis TaxID=442870 RepID=A0A8J7U2Q8_9BACT|nr:hypothetical protein [Acanthopleuribacter pedis]MBO1317984.1 hypothetical protein [Acanthopleuribacter pedis]